MHFYYLGKKTLEKGLSKFVGGQFQMKTKENWGYRGEIKGFKVLSERRIRIFFNWLCECPDGSKKLQSKWILRKGSLDASHLDVEWRYFYFQTDEDRVKIKGTLGEICHFFMEGDHTNLVKHEGEFIPYCSLHKLEFGKLVIKLLAGHVIKPAKSPA